MSECGGDCSDCENKGEYCVKAKLHELSSVKKTIAVVSGKGGVGKSSVCAMLAVTMQRKGFNAAVLDADLTGPSIPTAFGLRENADGTDEGIYPVFTRTGIQVISINLLLENITDPIVWRGPVLSEYVKSFWSKVIWTDVDYMFIDMPPGTGDVPLTVMQDLPIDGIVVVTSPQELVNDIVVKALNMAKLLKAPVLGIVENQAYFDCSECKKRHYIYGESKIADFAEKFGIPLCAELPINKDIARQLDGGLIELFEGSFLDAFSDALE